MPCRGPSTGRWFSPGASSRSASLGSVAAALNAPMGALPAGSPAPAVATNTDGTLPCCPLVGVFMAGELPGNAMNDVCPPSGAAADAGWLGAAGNGGAAPAVAAPSRAAARGGNKNCGGGGTGSVLPAFWRSIRLVMYRPCCSRLCCSQR